MSTPPEDPFASPPPAGSTPEATPAAAPPPPPTPPPTPPGVIATAPGVIASSPGILSDATAPPMGAPASTYVPPKPTGLSWAAIIATGSYVLLSVVGALMVATTIQGLKDQLADPENPQYNVTSTVLQGLSGIVGVTAFVFLALWMTKIRSNLAATGVKAGGPPAVEWWGWFVPIAWFVLPLLGMRAITRHSVNFALLAGWWIPFCLSFVAQYVAQGAVFGAIDWTTGELNDPGALDIMGPASWVAAILMFLSWLFLVLIIIRTTDRHLKTA